MRDIVGEQLAHRPARELARRAVVEQAEPHRSLSGSAWPSTIIEVTAPMNTAASAGIVVIRKPMPAATAIRTLAVRIRRFMVGSHLDRRPNLNAKFNTSSESSCAA